MPDVVHELLVIDTAAEKLGARGISEAEVAQMIDNRYVIAPNRRGGRRDRRELHPRRLMIGRSDGGRVLTVVVERTLEPTSWLVISGWDSAAGERRMLGS